MSQLFPHKDAEKKVEYLELIYDLIFVYIIGRNNSLLHAIDNGFIRPEALLTYLLSTLVILQIWYFTTLYINRYGDNGFADHIGIFVNMYLLYYMADGTRVHWQEYYFRYNVAWGLILVNLALQYLYRLKKQGGAAPWEDAHIKNQIRLLLIEAGIVFLSIPVYAVTALPFAPAAMVFGLVYALATKQVNRLMPVDFGHLTERVMLYVVFTFGEMIIGVSGYFEGGVSLTNVYYSLMAFLIVAGLFLTYGFFYDHVIDREVKTSGTTYMTMHIFLIAALNNITVALEFMRKPEVHDIPKNIFLVASIVSYFIFLFLTEKYAKVRAASNRRFFVYLLLLSAVFVGLMAVSFRTPAVSIAVSAVYIYAVFISLAVYGRRFEQGEIK